MLYNYRLKVSSQRLQNSLSILGAILAVAIASTPAAAVTQSWNGYHWARNENLSIAAGNNVSSAWTGYLTSAANAWSGASNIDYRVVAGGTAAAACAPVYGGVQVCSGNYGANHWLGYTNVWLAQGFIVQATVRLNDYYFAAAKYNTAAWRSMTVCQELGHSLGLDHTNVIRTNANIGSCMDYTNDPSGTAGGVNGTLANTGPNATDFAALDGIYANRDASQLASTKFVAGTGFGLDGGEIESIRAVPEPATWAMFVIGFGAIGGQLRRRSNAASPKAVLN